jgi:hypothetical protein
MIRQKLHNLAYAVMGLVMLAAPAAYSAPLVNVRVEFAPELSSALGAKLRTIFPAQLQAELKDRPIDGFPDGTRVIIRVQEIMLANEGIGSGFGEDGISSFDTAEGVAIVQDARGNTIKRVPLIANSSPAFGSSFMANEPGRVVRLMEIFAYWIPRQVHP